MTYATGLGQVNIGISSSDAVRRFLASQQYGTFGARTPTTATPIRTVTPTTFVPRTTTTFRPVTPTLPVLKAPTLAPKPSVSTISTRPTTVMVSSGGASPTSLAPQVAEETAGMSAALSPSKSPLPLILAGLAALFLLNRKKGR